MAAASIGDGRQQLLVEALTKANGRSSDPSLAGRSRQRCKLVAIGDPYVGQSVGEKQDAADVGAHSFEHLDPFQPAAGKVGLSSGVDVADGGRERRTWALWRCHQRHRVVVVDYRHLVVGTEPLCEETSTGLGHLQLFSGHRPRAIDDQGDRQRRPLDIDFQFRGPQLEEAVHDTV